MKALRRLTPARLWHWLFEMSLMIKAVLCSAEALAGLGLLLAPNPTVARLIYWLTHYEITDRPGDSMAAWTQRAVEQFPFSVQHSYGWYLLFHGGLKLIMVIMLWARVLWAYPAAMVVLGGFVIYQLAEYVHTGSPVLLLLAFFDFSMIVLIGHEYKTLKSAKTDRLLLAPARPEGA